MLDTVVTKLDGTKATEKGRAIDGYRSEVAALSDQIRYWKARKVQWSEQFGAKIKKEKMFQLHSSLAQSDPRCALACSQMRKHLRRFLAEHNAHHCAQ